MTIAGGSGLHAALSAAHFASTHLISKTGYDFPLSALKLLKNKGVDLSRLEVLTTRCNIWRADCSDPTSHKTIGFQINTPIALNETSFPLPKADFAFIAEEKPETQLSMINMLTKKTRILVDTKKRWVQPPHDETFKNVIRRSDYVMMNSEEAKLFFGTSNTDENLKKLLDLGTKVAIINMASQGSKMRCGSTTVTSPSIIKSPVDTRGAGDSFAGGFLGALAQGSTLREAFIFGQVMSSFAIEGHSPYSFLKLDRDQILSRFNS